jgi:hypothetical protein
MEWQRLVRLFFACLISSCASEPDPQPESRPPSPSERVVIGLGLAPVKLNLEGADLRAVGLGSYLVNAASGCVDCHGCPTYAPGQSPFKGGNGALNAEHYLGGGAVLGPGLVVPGLTPDARGDPGGLSRTKFYFSMRSGKDPDDPTRVLQIMPWGLYRHMSDEDLDAIYAYLRAIPHAEPGACTGPGQ